MARLNDRQLKLLRVIDEGNITGEDIVKVLGSSMQMTSYYLNTLADDGYLKVARVYDNETRDFLVVRAYLTDLGKASLESARIKASDTVMASPIATTSTIASPFIPHQIQPIDYARIAEAIAQINSQIALIPEGRRELIEVYIEDLKNEVNVAYRRKLIRLKAYFLAVLNILSPILRQGAEPFRQPIETIASQLQLDIQLPEKTPR